MSNAFILAMLAMLAFNTQVDNSILFWIHWVADLVFNMNWGAIMSRGD